MSGPSRPPTADLRTVACAPMGAGGRWAAGWHVLFYATLTLGLVLVTIDGSATVGLAAVAAASALWYGAGALLLRRTHTPTVAIVYALGLLGWWAALVSERGAFTVLAPSMFITVFGYLPWKAAIPAAAASSALLVVPQVRTAGAIELGHVVSAGLVFVVAVVVSRSFQTIATQSEERRRLLEELQATRAELADTEREAVRLAERQRLAGDIHDTLAQGFASIVVTLEAALESLRRNTPEAERHVRQALDAARDNLAEARRLVWSMRPESLDTDDGLVGALERTVARMADRTGLEARVRVDGPIRRLPADVDVALLRSAQEALANVERHAAASAVQVVLTYRSDRVRLTVSDDGRGFDVAGLPGPGQAGGVGLVAMHERAASLGGVVEVRSSAGTGTTVTVEVPTVPVPQVTTR